MLKYFIYHCPEFTRLEPILQTQKAVRVNNVDECDFILSMVESRKQFNENDIEYLNKTNKPLIIVERVDSCPIWFRDFNKLHHLKLVIKNRNFRNIQDNNEIMFKGRHHYLLIHKAFKLSTKYNCKEHDISRNWKMNKLEYIDDIHFDKIKTLLWDFHSSPLSLYSKEHVNQPVNISDRLIDVFCVSRSRYGIQDILRNRVKNIVNKMGTKYNVLTNKLDKSEYDKLFRMSKVCIACPGWGEWVHMDGYALLSRVILLKPECDYVKMDPDIYQKNTFYIPFKYDLSDLSEKIEYCINNYHTEDIQQMLDRGEQLIRNLCKETFIDNFWNIIGEKY